MIESLDMKYLPQCHELGDTKTADPRQSEPPVAHTNYVLNGMLELANIITDVSNCLFREAKSTDTDLAKIIAFYQRLHEWNENIVECLEPSNGPSLDVVEMQLVKLSFHP
jgi:hypothetical protein